MLLLFSCLLPAPPPQETTPAIERVVFPPVQRLGALLEPRLVCSYTVEGTPESWRIDREQVRTQEVDGSTFLLLPGQGIRHASLAGEFALDAFNEVSVRLLGTGGPRIQVRLRKEGRDIFHSPVRDTPASSQPRWVRFRMPEWKDPGEIADEVELVLSGPKWIGLEAVELREVSLGSMTPREEGTSFLALGFEGRTGSPLLAGAPLTGRFLMRDGARLSFSLGVPWRFDPDKTPCSIRVVVRQDEDSPAVEHRVPLALVSAVDGFNENLAGTEPLVGHWRSVSLDLTGLEPGPAEIELSLVAPEGARPVPLCFVGEPRVSVPETSPRRVILVTSDTHRADHVRAMPRSVDVDTPVLDALAARGIRFDNCLSTTNITNPSHISLMTGKHPRDFDIADNTVPLSDAAVTLAESFAAAGFVTLACVSVPHLFHDSSGLGQGFDRMSAYPDYYRTAGATIDVLLEWLEELPDRSLFVWLHLFDAHVPYHSESRFVARYYEEGRDPYDPNRPDALDPELLPRSLRGIADPEYPRALYRAEVTYLDDQLRRVVEHPTLRDAILAVTADHGECLGHHDVYYRHAGLYPDTVHVPLILVYPGCKAGQVRSDPVSHLALAGTLLELAGLYASPFGGESLLADEGSDPRFVLSDQRLEAAVYAGEWLLVLHLEGTDARSTPSVRRRERHKVELYRLSEDPGCLDDRVDRDPEVARGLRRTLIRWLSEREPLPWAGPTRATAETLEALEELGYTSGQAPALGELDLVGCDCRWCLEFR